MPNTLERDSVADTIRALARQHNVAYTPTASDRLGQDITRLAGDEVELDEPALLLLALERTHHISSAEATRLHGAYLRAKYEL